LTKHEAIERKRNLDTIRRNLLDASASLNATGVKAPPRGAIARGKAQRLPRLRQQVNDAWHRYTLLLQEAEMQYPRVGKKHGENLGFLIPIIIGLVAVAGIGGGIWGISHEVNESERLKRQTKCVEEETKHGMSREKALELCERIYGEGASRSGGGFADFDLTKVAIWSILGLGGFYLVKSTLKDVFD